MVVIAILMMNMLLRFCDTVVIIANIWLVMMNMILSESLSWGSTMTVGDDEYDFIGGLILGLHDSRYFLLQI